ncbi:MAG: amidohydrolase family protein [bacterium]|jgi:cytosine/adenosine deaminase-related metal-dependent hydrolase
MGTIVRAKSVLSDSRTLLRGKSVRVSRGRISEIGDFNALVSRNSGDRVLDFPNAAVLPGFINSHCHLELDWCKGRIGYNGNFIDWLQSIRDIKFGPNPPVPDPFPSIREMFSTGTTTLVDHYTMDVPIARVRATGLRYFPMREMFEFNNHEPDIKKLAAHTAYSFAVHAPYTASKEIALACKSLADSWRRPISTHLSEMRAEIEFIRTGNEDIERLLKKGDAHDPHWQGAGMTPVEYYYRLGMLGRRTYGIHLNYWEENDLYYLAKSGLTPVYCPKSHRYFRHPKHPVETYMRAGLCVALGTDSYASNDRLSVLHEARLVLETFPDMPLAALFDMITINGLRPLGLHHDLGRVRLGCIGDLTVWPGVAGESADEVIREIVTGHETCAATMVAGRVVHTD